MTKKEIHDVEFFESNKDLEKFLNNLPKYVIKIKKAHWPRNDVELIVDADVQEEEMRICPKCKQKTLEYTDEETMMGHFQGLYCTNPECGFCEVESSKPRWLIEEEKDSLVLAGKARYLPCGTFERADEYGGY